MIHPLDLIQETPVSTSVKASPSGRTTAHVLLRAMSSTYRNTSSNHFHVHVRPTIFRLWWCTIVLLHAFCFGFFGFSAWVYWKLPHISLGYTFAMYRITLPDNNLLAPALCFAVIALAHAFFLVKLVMLCIWRRRLTLDVQWFDSNAQRDRTFTLFDRIHSERLDRWSINCSWLMVNIFGRQGFLGVESDYFELVYIMREVVETALQSIQAYRLSLMVSRVYLSNFFAVLIFINCWSTPIVLHYFSGHPPLARLVCLLLDIGLDFVSTVVVPLVLVVPYFQYFDPIVQDFNPLIWYDDVLLVNALNEFRLVMITTWPELATRMLFSVSMLMCLENAKYLLRLNHCRKQTQTTPAKCTAQIAFETREPSRTLARRNQDLNEIQTSFGIRLAVVMHVSFMAWGLAVLIIHIHAASHGLLAGCALQVRPWFVSKPACALMYVNCHTDQMNGDLRDLANIMMRMDEHSLVHIVIRHCPNVEIPPQIQAFPHLEGMKIYNSTISRWGTEAALTACHHPNVILLYIVDVNMTQIPDGLLSEDFPQHLRDIEISGTNLTQLPDVLDERWQTYGLLVLELCSFEVFPDVLSRMKMSIFALGNNHFTDISAELLSNPAAFVIMLSKTAIASLPATLLRTVSAKYLILDYTNLTTLPSWIDEAFLENTEFSAVGTTACDQVVSAANGESASNHFAATLVHAYTYGSLKCDHVSYMVSPYYPRDLEKTLDEQFKIEKNH